MSEQEELGGLSCKLNLPLRWSQQMAAESSVDEQNNLSRMQIILSLDDSSRELQDADSDVAAEIHRLDFKINMILEMVAHLVTVGEGLPATLSVTLSPDHLVFDTTAEPPSQGLSVTLELFPDPRFPFPLLLPGKVAAVESLTSRSSRVRVVFAPFYEPFQELLEKYIFRCHRRHIARLKKSAI